MASHSRSPIELLDRYFNALDAADFETAAVQFTDDVVYVHPPMYGDKSRIEGRDALLRYFTDTRGKTDSLHHLDRSFETDDGVAVVGHVTPRDDDTILERFVSYAEVEDDVISYYAAGLVGE